MQLPVTCYPQRSLNASYVSESSLLTWPHSRDRKQDLGKHPNEYHKHICCCLIQGHTLLNHCQRRQEANHMVLLHRPGMRLCC